MNTFRKYSSFNIQVPVQIIGAMVSLDQVISTH